MSDEIIKKIFKEIQAKNKDSEVTLTTNEIKSQLTEPKTMAKIASCNRKFHLPEKKFIKPVHLLPEKPKIEYQISVAKSIQADDGEKIKNYHIYIFDSEGHEIKRIQSK